MVVSALVIMHGSCSRACVVDRDFFFVCLKYLIFIVSNPPLLILQIQGLAVWANVGFHYSHSFCYFLSSPSTSSFELSGVGGAHLFAMAFYSPTNIISGKKIHD